jgi:enoyl-CoA hydratase/carnithine racemase
MIPAAEALELGMVDELVPPGDVVERAVGSCRGLLELPQHSMTATRKLCRAELGELFDNRDALDIDAFVAGWFDEQTQATLRRLVERLKG